MKLWKRYASLTISSVCLCTGYLPALAQTSAVARDIQSFCTVSDIPALARLTISWTGDCVDGKATGVGNVIAFNSGELRYILRGQFTDGRLTRQDQLRSCSGDSCNDQVATVVLRQHQLVSRQNQDQDNSSAAHTPTASLSALAAPAPQDAAVTAPSQSPVVSVVPPVALTEIRAEDAVYKGRFEINRTTHQVSGQGRIEFSDGSSYEGRLEDGHKVGHGTYIWANGQRYSGNWLNDLPDGEGELISSGGDRYTGGFIKGRRQGQGRVVYSDKSEYNGTWRDDLPSGAGVIRFIDGDVYDGQVVAGKQSGDGTLTRRNGDRYTGSWQDGLRNGKGMARWGDGQRYDGDWRANLREGSGLMQFVDGGSYDGTWVGDRATGQGQIKFASGDSYAGMVSDGTPQGKGVYTWGSGDKFAGEFAGGRPTANGVMTFYIAPAVETVPNVAVNPPVVVPEATSVAASAAPVSKAVLCSRGYNASRNVAALKQFIEAFPDDECGRHALARQKISAFEENERKVAKDQIERQAQAKALIGLVVAYRQEHAHCVPVSNGTCQNVTYSFEVKGKIREVQLARQVVQLQVVEVTTLANEKSAPANLFSEGKSAATDAFRKRMVGSMQTKSKNELGLEF